MRAPHPTRSGESVQSHLESSGAAADCRVVVCCVVLCCAVLWCAVVFLCCAVLCAGWCGWASVG